MKKSFPHLDLSLYGWKKIILPNKNIILTFSPCQAPHLSGEMHVVGGEGDGMAGKGKWYVKDSL